MPNWSSVRRAGKCDCSGPTPRGRCPEGVRESGTLPEYDSGIGADPDADSFEFNTENELA